MVTNNLLLAQLPQSEEAILTPYLRRVELASRETLYRPGDKIDDLYFPEQGLISMVTIMADGRMSEAGMIGFEGVVAASALLGIAASSQHVLVQIPGGALQIDVIHCSNAFQRCAVFRVRILRYIGYYGQVCAQVSACNRLHTTLQRCARWLLMASDRAQSSVIPVTHEFLSAMLGVRRTGMTPIMQELERRALIERRQGIVKIVDRGGLERAACECYRKQLQWLFSPGSR
jgi:CRP-like cAMP-binding protein